MQGDVAFELAEEFLNAYDADDNSKALEALRKRLGIKKRGVCILAEMMKYYAANH